MCDQKPEGKSTNVHGNLLERDKNEKGKEFQRENFRENQHFLDC